MKTYREMMEFGSYYDRLQYLRVRGKTGSTNEEVDRYFAETFYRSSQWKKVRRDVLLRDNFCDLSIPGLNIQSGAIVHHIAVLTMDDVLGENYAKLFGLDNLITTSLQTHNAIHYGIQDVVPVERYRDDHIPWKKGEN